VGSSHFADLGRQGNAKSASPQGSEIAVNGHLLHAGMGRLRLWDGLHALQVVLVMAPRLRKNEICPLHRSKYCCGRERPAAQASRLSRWPLTQPVKRIEDPHHPRGYREVCTNNELRKRKMKLLQSSKECFYCHEEFEDFGEVELCHLISKGHGGGKHDDSFDNLVLGHRSCNRENGSKSYRGTQ
jgi:hypothetical protein